MGEKRRMWMVASMLFAGALGTRGEAALFLEEPGGTVRGYNRAGHVGVYLSRVCAETPVKLRRCEPGETGAVISRYHRVSGYDWIAMPLLPYLYAVERPEQVPDEVNEDLVAYLRDSYRKNHLRDMIPDEEEGEMPKGEWIQLVGAAYVRRIHSFEIETTPEQDDRLIQELNSGENQTHFNILFHNCADFARSILNSYYPGAVGRNFISDVGIMTPRQAAKALLDYSKRNSDLKFSSLLIQQVPGTLPRSRPVEGVLGSFVKSKKYMVPAAILHPFVIAGVAIAYFVGPSHERPHAGSMGDPPLKPQGIAARLQTNRVVSPLSR